MRSSAHARVSRDGRRPAWLLLGLVFASAPAFAEELLWYAKDGQVVFTNTPSRADAQPVPGLRERKRVGVRALPATRFDPFIERVALENGLDADLIKAVALVESGFNPEAVSPKGARGIMQLMPATAREYGVEDPHDPYESLRAGARHLRDLLDDFDGDVRLALAAYNAGAGAVRRHGGVPAYPETRSYVRKVEQRLGRSRTARRSSEDGGAAPPEVRLVANADGSVSLIN